MEQSYKFLSLYSLPALLTPLQLMHFTTEETTVCTNEVAKDANKAPGNSLSCFFILCFTGSVAQSINTPKSSNDFMILIISFISSFEIHKVNLSPALTAPFLLCFNLVFYFIFN